ncbi:MAG: ABC transporter substrate-binding protein, partial [Chloroflexia bacterium]|nr:ABC transporter substrate-binding protein [Chloroflexia bacterium]
YIEQITGQAVDNAFYAPKTASVAPGAPFPAAAPASIEQPTTAAANPDVPTLRVSTNCGPTPHAMPLFAMLAQQGLSFPAFNLEYVPGSEATQTSALLINGEVDLMLGQIIQTARMQTTAVPDLRLWSTSMSKGFYVMAGEGVNSWQDLLGQRILMPGPTSGPSNLAMASMRAAGYNPEQDFAIEHLPASQIVQLMVAGEAPAAVIAEPFVTMIVNRSRNEGKAPISPAPIDLYALYASDQWRVGELPLDGILVLQSVLDDPERRAAFEAFATAYHVSSAYILANPTEASTLIAAQLDEQCDSMIQPKLIQTALESGRLVYAPNQAVDLLPDLDTYIELVLGQEVNDVFYAQP